MKISKEFKIGGLTILAIVLLMWGNSFLKGKKFFNPQTELYAVYDNVNGLVKTNPVMLNGLKVGQVESVKFLPDKSGKLLVCFFVDRDFSIPKNSIAKLTNNGLLGSKALQIILGDATQYVESYDTLLSAQEAGLSEQIQPIAYKLGNIIEQMDSILVAVNHVLNEQTQADLINSINDLQVSLRHISSITAKADVLMKNNADQLTNIVANAESFTANLKANNDELTHIIRNFSAISDTIQQSNLSAAIHNLSTTLESLDDVLVNLKNGEGTAGKLLTNDSLYFELNRSAEQLNLLLEDIRNNPKKYVRISVF
ncbi:MAG: MlaD family protein [Bacteroidales bacterium]|nr:MlaD family protein [Bacteroidales bacterium]